MATTTVEDGRERIQTMFRSVEDEFEKLQKKVDKQTKRFRKTTEKRVKRVRSELDKMPLYKQAQSFRKDTNKQVEKGVDQILSALNIATRTDVKKLDRKLNQINKKLKELSAEG